MNQTEIFPNNVVCLADNGTGQRILVVPDADSLAVPTVCYASCQDCEPNVFLTSRVKLTVDMTDQEVPEEGMFIRGNFFNGFPEPMIAEENNIWSYTIRVSVLDTLTYQFGKGMFEAEVIATDDSCLTPGGNDMRMLIVPNTDLHIPPTVCFGSCMGCQTTNTIDLVQDQQIRLLPNIVHHQAQLVWNEVAQQVLQIIVFDGSGKVIQQYTNVRRSPFLLEHLPTQPGFYFLSIQNNEGQRGALKLVIQ